MFTSKSGTKFTLELLKLCHYLVVIKLLLLFFKGFPHSSVSKEPSCNAGDPGSIPGLGRSPGEGNGNPLQYSCLRNPMDRGAWWATYSPWDRKSWTQLS